MNLSKIKKQSRPRKTKAELKILSSELNIEGINSKTAIDIIKPVLMAIKWGRNSVLLNFTKSCAPNIMKAMSRIRKSNKNIYCFYRSGPQAVN